MNFRKSISSTIAVIAMFVSSMCFAQVSLPEGGASGSWYNPARDGEGVFVEIVQAGSGSRISAAWFTYDLDGFQMYLTGAVDLEVNSTIATIPVAITNGPKFGTGYDSNDLNRTTWGTITLAFDTCSTGVLSYASSSPDFGSGDINLTRLTNLEQVRCSEPPPVTGLTPGRWSGPGVCFYVEPFGRALVSKNSTCDSSRSVDTDIENQVDENGNNCDVEVETTAAISIVQGSFSYSRGGESILGTFTSSTSATGLAQEVESSTCTAQWTASPDNP